MIKILKGKKNIVIISATIILVVIILLMRTQLSNISIMTTLPKDGVIDVPTNQNVVITFDRDISDEEINNVIVDMFPDTLYRLQWGKDTLTIIPEYGFQGGIKYIVLLRLQEEELGAFSFTTSGIPIEEIAEVAKQQTIDDFEFGQDYKQILDEDPWYGRLPIVTNRFTIVYDNVRQAFRIRLSQTPVSQEERTEVINEALDLLKQIEAPEPPIYNVLLPGDN